MLTVFFLPSGSSYITHTNRFPSSTEVLLKEAFNEMILNMTHKSAGLKEYNFSSSQAAEKALKAARYAVDTDSTRVHNLIENCCDLNDPELSNLARQLECLVGDSTRMRYPDRMCFPQIPNEVYSAEMAQQALQLAKKIVARVQSRIT